jgi:uncharacterized UPF0160 family protein
MSSTSTPRPFLVATHDGAFHADDVFGVAIVKRALRLEDPRRPVSVIRTRDKDLLAGADIVLDVGGVFDGESRFDHHQPEGAGARRDGVPYAAAGLAWQRFGHQILRASLLPDASEQTVALAFRRVDRSLIRQIDATDNGITLGHQVGLSMSDVVSHMAPTWLEDRSAAALDARFADAVALAGLVLDNLCRVSASRTLAQDVVRRAASGAGAIVVLEHEGIPWHETIITEFPDALFVLYPATGGGWRVRAIPVALGSFVPRRQLPAHWAGLDGTQLTELTGIPGCVFAHRGRFLAGNETLEGARRLAELAIAAG